MAKQMSFTKNGRTYPASVWFPVNPNPDFSMPSGSIVFNGYETLELASTALKHSFGVGGQFIPPLDQHLVPLNADQMRELANAINYPPGANVLTILSVLAYQMEAAYLCVPAPTEQEPDRKVSFFANATDVVVPLS